MSCFLTVLFLWFNIALWRWVSFLIKKIKIRSGQDQRDRVKVSETDKPKCWQRHGERRSWKYFSGDRTRSRTSPRVISCSFCSGPQKTWCISPPTAPLALNNLSKLMQQCLCTAQTLQCIMQSTGSNRFTTQAGETHPTSSMVRRWDTSSHTKHTTTAHTEIGISI